MNETELALAGASSSSLTIRPNLFKPLPGDANGDGVVNIDDLFALIAAWGPCSPPPPSCPADLDDDGDVDIDDLFTVIANWD